MHGKRKKERKKDSRKPKFYERDKKEIENGRKTNKQTKRNWTGQVKTAKRNTLLLTKVKIYCEPTGHPI